MRLANLKVLAKLKKKNLGNANLMRSIDRLIQDLENNSFDNFEVLKRTGKDADRVHPMASVSSIFTFIERWY